MINQLLPQYQKKKKEFLENNSGSGILLEDAKEIIASFF